jgi:hypothetical protein
VRSGDKGVHKVKDVDKVNGVDEVNAGVGNRGAPMERQGGAGNAVDVPPTVTLLTLSTLWSLAAAHKARVTSSHALWCPRPLHAVARPAARRASTALTPSALGSRA